MFYLKRNLPATERVLRLAAGLLLAMATLRWMPGDGAAWGAATVAALLAGTAAVGYCPACAVLGRRPKERTK